MARTGAKVLALACSALLAAACQSEPQAAAPGQAISTVRNDVPSCRARWLHDTVAPTPSRELFVFVDRTTSLDEHLRGDVVSRILRAIAPGDRMVLATFSAFHGANYSTVVFDGMIEAASSEADLEKVVTSAVQMKQAQRCFVNQENLAKTAFSDRLRAAMSSDAASYQASEILLSLKDFSVELVAAGRSNVRRVVVVSDMLENSDITSFYLKQRLRLLDPQAEMAKATANSAIGTLQGANVYVIGAALAPAAAPRGSRERRMLEAFWTSWFEASGGHLRGWGEPELMHDIDMPAP